MATGWSSSPRRQAISQGCVQTLPQMPGSTLSRRIRSKASGNFPALARATYPCAFTPSGQLAWHRGWRRLSMTGWPGRLCLPPDRMGFDPSGDVTGHTSMQRPQSVQRSGSMKAAGLVMWAQNPCGVCFSDLMSPGITQRICGFLRIRSSPGRCA